MKQTIRYLKDKLSRDFNSPNPNLIYRLGKLAHPEATSILITMLENPNIISETRLYILAALRYTHDPRAKDILFHYFQNGYETSTEVINSIGVLQEKRAVPQLIKILNNETQVIRDYHSTLSLRFRATIALGNIGDERAIPILEAHLNEYRLVLRYALSDVQLQVPLCEYAFDALIKIGTPQACRIARNWKHQYAQRLQLEAELYLSRMKGNQPFTYLLGDLVRIKHYALPILASMSTEQLQNFPDVTYHVLKELAKQDKRIPVEAKDDIANFIVDVLEHSQPHLTLEQGFSLLDFFDTPRSIPLALNTFVNFDCDNRLHGNPLSLLSKKRVREAVPIIEHKIFINGINERYLSALGTIGGEHAEHIVTSYLHDERSQIQRSAIYALADLAKESDSALETLSQLIDCTDYGLSQQAIIRMDRVGSRAIYILLNMIRNYDKWSSTRALSTLARIGDSRIIPHIIELIADPNYGYLHHEAINTLEKIGGEVAYEVVNNWQSAEQA